MLRRLVQVILAIFFVLILSLAGLVYHLRVNGLMMSFTEEQVQAQVENAFPIERPYMRGVTLTLFDPLVTLNEETNRLEYQMSATIHIEQLRRDFSGQARISGVLRFEPETAEFFLDDSRIEELNVEAIPSLFRNQITEGAERFARQHLNDRPVYQLEGPLRGEGLLSFLPPAELRELYVKDRKLYVRLGL